MEVARANARKQKKDANSGNKLANQFLSYWHDNSDIKRERDKEER